MNKAEILIIGGTGKVGNELVTLLANSAVSCRLLVRNISRAKIKQSDCLQVIQGDLEDSESIKAALQGVKNVFLLSRDQPGQGQLEGNMIDLAVEEGVEKLVKSSAFAAGLQPPVGYGITHAVSEKKLINSGLKWVILRPYVFMQNFLEIDKLIRNQSLIPLPMGKAKIGLIDARDVALVAKTVLTEDKWQNQACELTGPELLSLDDCALIFSRVLGRSVRYRSPPFWVAGLMMSMQGVSCWDIKMRKQLFRMIREGGEAKITSDVENICGQKPRKLEDFVREHIHTFEGSEKLS